MTIEECHARTRKLRNDKIEKWLDGSVDSFVMEHHFRFVWGKKFGQ